MPRFAKVMGLNGLWLVVRVTEDSDLSYGWVTEYVVSSEAAADRYIKHLNARKA